MSKMEDLISMSKLNEFLNRKEEKKHSKAVWVFAIIGIVAAVAGIAYAVYRFCTPDYLEDFEDEFEDDFEEDFFEEDEETAETAGAEETGADAAAGTTEDMTEE